MPERGLRTGLERWKLITACAGCTVKTYHHPLRGEASIKNSAAGATSSADGVSHWGQDSTEAEVIPPSWILCAHGGGRLANLFENVKRRVFCRVLIPLWDLALILSKNIAILMWKIIHWYHLWNRKNIKQMSAYALSQVWAFSFWAEMLFCLHSSFQTYYQVDIEMCYVCELLYRRCCDFLYRPWWVPV